MEERAREKVLNVKNPEDINNSSFCTNNNKQASLQNHDTLNVL